MEFLDYNRTVIGYHGTDLETALDIVQRKREFSPSTQGDDWLGDGVYFWEHAPKQAIAWAKRRAAKKGWPKAAVLGSMVRLGHCLDLLDPANTDLLVQMHDAWRSELVAGGVEPPANAHSRKWLDCAVFRYAYEQIEAEFGTAVDTSRVVYVGTAGGQSRVWKTSWIVRDAHLQLCVRNRGCILGTWLHTVLDGTVAQSVVEGVTNGQGAEHADLGNASVPTSVEKTRDENPG